MKIGDRVRVIDEKHDLFGKVGVVIKLVPTSGSVVDFTESNVNDYNYIMFNEKLEVLENERD
jgi:hypothetical protein